MTYSVILRKSEEAYCVSCAMLPGCFSQGAAEAEALDNISDAIQGYLEVFAESVAKREISEVEITV